eukprot:763668-Hanusia_phi.AAC.2
MTEEEKPRVNQYTMLTAPPSLANMLPTKISMRPGAQNPTEKQRMPDRVLPSALSRGPRTQPKIIGK